jgi:amino acid adenylation domain-containing protein
LVSIAAAVLGPALGDTDSQSREAPGGARATSPPIDAAAQTQDVDPPPLLDEAERHRVLVEWNATEADYPQDKCVHELIEEQAARTPDAIAVVYESERLTCAELNARANRLAHHLRSLGVRPDDRVAICAERSLEMVIGLLAIHKAGGAYVPLDPGYPAERLAFMLEDSAPTVALTHGAARAALEEGMARLAHRPPILAVDDDAAWIHEPTVNPDPAEVGLTSRHLAHVIYTSGSTGQPKGAMNEHRGVVNRVAWGQRAYGLTPGDRVLQKTPFSFDVSAWEFFWPLSTGARLVMARPGGHRNPAYLSDIIRAEGITTLHFVPSMMGAFLEVAEASNCMSLRRVFTSGEALPAGLVRLFHQRLPGVELHNLYGPTETAIEVTAWTSTAGALPANIPIGRPISNTRIYILDRNREPVPIGATGEIHIGGVQVCRGYLNRPRLTAERFIANPFVEGERLYRTGDLGRFRPDGTIEYLGRNDFQVKIRGFRIELGEIEARLAEHPGVREAVVLAREDAPGEKRLVAYITARPGAAPPGAEALREHLAASLPEYMVPAAYVALEALPLSANGKLDRKALPAPGLSAFAARRYDPPLGETEERLARIWAEELKLERFGRHDNFFDLGGHSLLAIRLLSRIGAIFKTSLPLSTVFHSPTIAALAELLQNQRAPSQRFSLVPIQPAGSRPPLFCVEDVGVELFKFLGADQPVYNLRYGVGSPPGSTLVLPTIEALAAHYIEELRAVQPNDPYFLIGYSWGGLVAYETARQLTANGERVEFVALVDTLLPIAFKHSLGDRAIKIVSYSPSVFFEKLTYKLKTRLTIESLRYNFVLWLKKLIYGSKYYRPDSFDLETIYTVMRSYCPGSYSGRVIFFKATENSTLANERLELSQAGWKELVGAGLEIEGVTCDHDGIMKRPYVAQVAHKIRAAMDGVLNREGQKTKLA